MARRDGLYYCISRPERYNKLNGKIQGTAFFGRSAIGGFIVLAGLEFLARGANCSETKNSTNRNATAHTGWVYAFLHALGGLGSDHYVRFVSVMAQTANVQ
jgi:hypothetical protein